MGRILGIVLMAILVWYGVEKLSAGMERASASPPAEQGVRDDPREPSTGPPPITTRVRDRVNAAMEQRMNRQDAR